jgi:hypothetical protein
MAPTWDVLYYLVNFVNYVIGSKTRAHRMMHHHRLHEGCLLFFCKSTSFIGLCCFQVGFLHGTLKGWPWDTVFCCDGGERVPSIACLATRNYSTTLVDCKSEAFLGVGPKFTTGG